jgi:hypothetical protein
MGAQRAALTFYDFAQHCVRLGVLLFVLVDLCQIVHRAEGVGVFGPLDTDASFQNFLIQRFRLPNSLLPAVSLGQLSHAVQIGPRVLAVNASLDREGLAGATAGSIRGPTTISGVLQKTGVARFPTTPTFFFLESVRRSVRFCVVPWHAVAYCRSVQRGQVESSYVEYSRFAFGRCTGEPVLFCSVPFRSALHCRFGNESVEHYKSGGQRVTECN